MLRGMDVILARETRRHRTPWTDVGRADVGINPDEMDGEVAAFAKRRNCQEEKARWLPAEWKKWTESKDSITGKFLWDFFD